MKRLFLSINMISYNEVTYIGLLRFIKNGNIVITCGKFRGKDNNLREPSERWSMKLQNVGHQWRRINYDEWGALAVITASTVKGNLKSFNYL